MSIPVKSEEAEGKRNEVRSWEGRRESYLKKVKELGV
jgi:hypothetical protein